MQTIIADIFLKFEAPFCALAGYAVYEHASCVLTENDPCWNFASVSSEPVPPNLLGILIPPRDYEQWGFGAPAPQPLPAQPALCPASASASASTPRRSASASRQLREQHTPLKGCSTGYIPAMERKVGRVTSIFKASLLSSLLKNVLRFSVLPQVKVRHTLACPAFRTVCSLATEHRQQDREKKKRGCACTSYFLREEILR
ncbi:hypothetical protein AOLI_G00112070 [Acnodon oligacanthus]